MNGSDQPRTTMPGETGENGSQGETNVIAVEAPRVTAPSGPAIVEKVILLVDTNPVTRDSRARAMESRGLNIHTAASSGEAVSRFSLGAYDLVLIDLGHRDRAERLAQDLRLIRPKQRVAFLVGGPKYVISSPVKKQPSAAVAKKAASEVVPFDFGQRVRETEADKA